MQTERERTSTRRPAPTGRARCRGDRGAIIVEAAFVTPVFLVLMFGILEFGGAFRDYLTLNNAASSASRQASISANSIDADYQVIQAIKKQTAAMPPGEILNIVIFHPATPSSDPTASCMAGNPSSGTGAYVDACNTYTSAAFSWASASVNWGCGGRRV